MADLTYTRDVENLKPEQLTGFFVGWPHPPTSEQLFQLLNASPHRWVAFDPETDRVAGYITGLTDNVLFAYISSLEVRPEYQHRGIGQELVRRMLDEFRHVYAVDLVCDANVQPFYARCGMLPCQSMVVRRPGLLQRP